MGLMLSGACRQSGEPSAAPPPIVQVASPRPAPATVIHELSGQIVALRQSALAFQVAGRIATRTVEVGQRVEAGEVLMTLDDRDYRLRIDSLRAQMASVRAELTAARKTLQRMEGLLARKLAAQQDVDTARSLVERLEGSLASLRAQLKQAENQRAYTRLTAPWAGIVIQRQGEVGQVVGAGVPVLTLAQSDQRAVAVALPRTFVSAPPETVRVRWADHELEAVLHDLTPMADPASRTWQARYRLAADAPPIPLGAIVQVEVARPMGTETEENAPLWVVPAGAVQMARNESRLFVVVSGRLQSVPVSVVRVEDGRIWVRGALQPDADVVTMGVHLLNEGQAVRVRRDG